MIASQLWLLRRLDGKKGRPQLDGASYLVWVFSRLQTAHIHVYLHATMEPTEYILCYTAQYVQIQAYIIKGYVVCSGADVRECVTLYS